MFSHLLFTRKCDKYVSNESGTTLRSDSIHFKFHKGCIKSNVMFSEKHLVTLWLFRQSVTSKSMQCLIMKWRTNDYMCFYVMLFMFVYLLTAVLILTFSLNTDSDQNLFEFCRAGH